MTGIAVKETNLSLRERWDAYRADNKRARIYDAADALGVSEAALLATECGTVATRLDAPWGDVLKALEAAGEVMALTRNHWAVIETTGRYAPVSINGPMGLVHSARIDLRLFLRTWQLGFAVEHPDHPKYPYSLQFFDGSGRALHKVYLPEVSSDAFQAIRSRFRSNDQGTDQPVDPPTLPPECTPDSDVDAEGLIQAWGALEDTHDFFGMLKQFAVGRTQAFRIAEGRFTRRLPVTVHRTILEEAAASELPIMVFVGNSGCIEIRSGIISQPIEARGWYNILDSDFNLHLNEKGIHETWLVRKPTRDGIVTSVELYNRQGQELVQLFGERKPGIPELEAWRALVENLPVL